MMNQYAVLYIDDIPFMIDHIYVHRLQGFIQGGHLGYPLPKNFPYIFHFYNYLS